MLILLLFFFSGATALVYEVIWSKYLALLFGSTIQAQTIVLAAFMGGLALGNKIFGRHADRSRRPLVIYGTIEVIVGLYALLFPSIYVLAQWVFATAGSGSLDRSMFLLLLKGLLSAVILLGPTILMGGTLPMLASWLQRSTSDPGRGTARFYAINSIGAVCGAGFAGFFLVQCLGMRGAMFVTAVVNLLIGVAAVLLGRASKILQRTETEDHSKSPVSENVQPIATDWACVLVALTGGVSMGLEVLASRCLGLILGASLQVFAIVLMAFILGIGAGSALISSPRRRHWSATTTTTVLLIGAAALIGVLVFNIQNLATWYVLGQSGLSRTPIGYRYHQFMALVLSVCILGLPAAALGSVLPLWIRASDNTPGLLGDRVGRLLTWNTLGAVVGVLLTGFALMPGLGLRGSFTTVALLLAIIAIITAVGGRWRIGALVAVVVTGLVGLLAVRGGEDWRQVLSSGIFRVPEASASAGYLENRRKAVHLLFYEDAADATVSVESEGFPNGVTNISLRINGKPDASSPGDLSTQILLGQLPLMMRPESKDVFCLGMGSGISAGTTLGYPIEHLTVADNCEPVLRAARFFDQWSHGMLTNSRTRVYHEDARTVLKLSPQKYDVIISEPSNPWMVGIGSVFSREFYQIAASRLKPGGMMSQWLYTYELDDSIFELVVRTFGTVFPSMEIWDVGEGDVVLLGSDRPWKSDVDVYRRAFELEGPRQDLASIGLTTPTAVLARQFASQRTAFAVPGPGRIQTDNNPVLEYEAPRQFYLYLGRGAQQFQNYDERTWQMDLAPASKHQALRGMELPTLNAIFGGIAPSVNHDLENYLRNRIAGEAGSLVFGNRVMPCIFDGTNSSAMVFAPPSGQTNALVRGLYFAEVGLRTDPKKQATAVEEIKGILDEVRSYSPREADWSPAYYADLAAKASLSMGKNSEAASISSRGLELEPDSQQLKYLLRVISRATAP